ncbi:mitochondrial dna helicase [Seiridium cupressi]
MNTRQLSALPSRPFLALRIRPHILSPHTPRPRQAHVHASPRSVLSSPGVMLGRANKNYKASLPAAPSSKSDLKKELFPSSSPAIRDGNISDFTHRGSQSSSASASASQSARTSASWGSTKATSFPLKPKSDNVQRPPTASITSFVKPTSGFSSLYSRSDSFKDEPVTSAASNSTAGDTAPSVYIAEDDFSDDDALELDYQCPSALPPPSLPHQKDNGTRSSAISIHDTPPTRAYQPSPATSTQYIPWTSSPLEHFYPPPQPRRQSVKRESPDDPNPAPVVTVAKRRKLPASYSKQVKEESSIEDEDDIDLFKPSKSSSRLTINGTLKKERNMKKEDDGDLFAAFKSTATPAAKPKPALPWDTTHSAIKAKKNQFKVQSKVKVESQADLSMDEIRSAAAAHHKTTHAAVSLSAEQQHVQELVIEKKQSVFFTGPAGTGKSVLMRGIIAGLKKKWASDPERLSITASTGLAACNIGGMTLHSFAGIGLGKEDVPTLVKKIRRNPKAKNRWLRTRVLIIDEVSMVDAELFDKLSQIAREIRNNGRPWGGIQLVITGDFFQLPPVPDRNKRDTKFAFDAATWNTSIDHTIGLTQVFRQRDHDFANMLNEMRLGRVSEDTVQTFKSLSRPLVYDDGLNATELFPTRQEVDRSNETRLRALPGEVHSYVAEDSGDPNIRDKLLENMMAPKSIELKKDAQVMLIKNLDDNLVNGSLGKVLYFTSEAFFEANSKKMHGNGADSGDDEADMSAAKKKIKSYSRDSSLKDMKEYPVIQFNATDGTHRVLHIMPEEWKVELPNGDIQAKRTALPLILAWALSIHKAQGQTLERVKVDLGKIFEKGQAYVALSRATSKDGLQVLRFDKSKVMAHPRVIQFYNKLYSAESAVKKKTPTTISDFAKGRTANSVRNDIGVIDLDDDEEAMAAYG